MKLSCYTDVYRIVFLFYLCRMKEQDLKDLLARPELNKSAIADKMYPNNKYARTTLNNKLKENQYGNDSTRKLNDDDQKKGWKVLKDLADDIYSRAPEKKKSEE